MNVKIGTPRRRQTSKSLRVCGFDALAGVDHHQGRVHGGQHAVGVLGEILAAGGVEQGSRRSPRNRTAGPSS